VDARHKKYTPIANKKALLLNVEKIATIPVHARFNAGSLEYSSIFSTVCFSLMKIAYAIGAGINESPITSALTK
jgi:hypothetical protein